MIRVAIGLLAALALAACGKAERTDLPAPSPALWQVTAPDGKPAGWLFGTIHALPEGAKWRDSAIEKAIVDADLLVVEAKDLDDSGKLSAIFTRLSHSADMPPLSERVPAAMQGRLQALLKKGGYREADFKAIETWAAAIMLAQLADDSIGENGVDRALLHDFRARPIEELEGVEGQFAIFDRLPESDQRDLLGAVVEEDTMDADDSARLAKLWLKGDMDAIAREGDDGMLADPELKQALLVDRNKAWADKLLALHAQGKRPLVAVGAAHLAPPGGLPELLAAKGYKVARVR
ncbi:TraB/GumN family protein [Tsuneonella rigui]|uniref:TraB/GumN family protein n=1 Tax=Tsuneonella rigui TaxID=1708790 RepID=UPI0013DF3B89|nr:TraB/GumN family protein [Tsuneonella rigui]